MFNRRSWFNPLVLLTVFLLVTVGCAAPAGPATGKQAPAEKEQPAPTEPPAEEPAAEQAEITYVTTQSTATFDPAIHTDETQSIMVINAYDSFLAPQEDGSPGPNVATDWKVSEDGTAYTFTIRQGIKFHDGSGLTAEDVAFSMDRMLRISKGYSWLWKGILQPGNTTAVDDYTVEFQLDQAYSPFLATLVQFFIVNKDLVLDNLASGDYGEFQDYGQDFLTQQDAGSGAYVISRYDPGSLVVFEAFEDYWRGWEPGQVRRVNMRVIGETATEKLMLEQGEADIVEQWLDPQQFEDLKKAENVVVQEDPSAQLFFLTLNNQKPPLDDVNVRRAISHAFDYETAANQIFQGASQARGPVPRLMPGHNPDAIVYQQDLDKAKELLAKSKYAGQDLKLTFVYVEQLESERKIGLLLQNNLAELGIDVELQGARWARIVEMVADPETSPHMVAIFHTAKYPNPDSHTFAMFHPSAHGTYMSASWYENPEVSQLLVDARQAVTQEEAMEKYMQAQEIVAEEAAALFVTNSIHRIAHRDRVEGYNYIPILGWDLYWYTLRVTE
ncbi:MAG: ABC transporter substrate-binding protein [Anaerolineae bacterium]